MNPRTLHGVGVALVTPFHEDGSIDWAGLERLLQHVSDGGVQYLVVQGTTGESATTTKAEKKELLRFVKTHNPRNLPVVYGVGGNHTPEVIRYLEETDFEKVTAILSVCPYYNKPGARGVIWADWYRDWRSGGGGPGFRSDSILRGPTGSSA